MRTRHSLAASVCLLAAISCNPLPAGIEPGHGHIVKDAEGKDRLPDSITYTKLMDIPSELEVIGNLKDHKPGADRFWTINSCCEDREFGKFSEYKDYLEELGIGRIRTISGWARTERSPGIYDFGWLDEIVDGAWEKGMSTWMVLGYANPLYKGDRELGASIFTDGPVMDAWLEYVRNVVERYRGKVSLYEIWNEPNNARNHTNPGPYINLFIKTAELVRSLDPDAEIAGLSLIWDYRDGFTRSVLDALAAEGKLHLLDVITFHPYTFIPNAVTQSIRDFRNLVNGYSTGIKLYQGECGAPASLEFLFALSDHEWTEYSQAKWRLGRMCLDFMLGTPGTVFGIADVQYSNITNPKGLIRTDKNCKAAYIRPSFYAVKHLVNLLGPDTRADESVSVKVFGTRKPVTSFGIEKGGKTVGAAFWYSGEIPGDSLEKEMKRIRIDGIKLSDPVYVEPMTGRVCEIKGKVPVWDSPAFVFERSAIDFEPCRE